MLTRLGADIPDAELEGRRTAAGPDDLATLIYTSGTTGQPKGCMLTHGNFLAELGVTVRELDALFSPTDGGEPPATLLFLPLAHVFARVIQVGAVRARVRLGHSADIRGLVPTLKEFRPTFVLAVPRVFEKVFNTASQRATADGHGKTFERAALTAIAYSRALEKGRPSIALRARHAAPRPAGLRQAPRRAGRRVPVRRLGRGSRSASGSATSTAASASRCSRATDSPRPPPR